MAPQFILASQLSPLSTKKAMRVRLVRTYEVRQKHNINEIKSKECVFHDEEVQQFNHFMNFKILILACLY